MQKIFLLLVGLLILLISGKAQTKFEREYRLKIEEVPMKAQQYVKELGAAKKVKWYKEISQSGKSIEGKTKINGNCYSIEFDTAGILEDVEVRINWNEIEPTTQQQIINVLALEFDKFKTKKVQRQYTGDAEGIKQVLLNGNAAENLTVRYEIVIKGKKGRKVKLYEFLFSEKGALLEKLTIELRNTDNLEY